MEVISSIYNSGYNIKKFYLGSRELNLAYLGNQVIYDEVIGDNDLNYILYEFYGSDTLPNTVEAPVKSAILKGSTKYRDIDTGDILDTFDETKNLELVSVKVPVLTTYTNLFTGFINRGYINADGNAAALGNNQNMLSDFIEVKFKSIAFRRFKKDGTPVNSFGEFAFYDKNKNFISRRISMDKVDESITLPNNTRYIRIWSKPVDKDDGGWDELAVLIYSNEAPSQIKSYLDNKTNILTVNEDVTLRSNGDVYDELNLLTGRLTQRIDENNEVLAQEVVKTVDLTIVDQDGKTINKLNSFNGTTHVSTDVAENSAYPMVSLEVASELQAAMSKVTEDIELIKPVQNDIETTIDTQSNDIDSLLLATTELFEMFL